MNTDALQARLTQAGLKASKPRLALLALLAKAPGPLTVAAMIQALNQEAGSLRYWPSTLYRSLDLLESKGLVSRYELPGSDQAAYVLLEQGRDQHYALCTACHRLLPLSHCPLPPLEATLQAQGFAMTGHRVEVYGLCADCQPPSPKRLPRPAKRLPRLLGHFRSKHPRP